MKATFDILNSLHHLKLSRDFMRSFMLDNPESVGARMLRPYTTKMEWIAADLITNPRFPQPVRDAIRNEWQADGFVIPAIDEKIAQLSPEQREILEGIIDLILEGETIKVVQHDRTDHSDANNGAPPAGGVVRE